MELTGQNNDMIVLILYQQEMFLSLLAFKENIKLILVLCQDEDKKQQLIINCVEGRKMKLFLPDKFKTIYRKLFVYSYNC